MIIDPSQRVVIVSTSAGQSGITIPGKYCIDLVISDGITKSPELDEEGGPGLPCQILHTTRTSSAKRKRRKKRFSIIIRPRSTSQQLAPSTEPTRQLDSYQTTCSSNSTRDSSLKHIT